MTLRAMRAIEKDEGRMNLRPAVVIAENPFDVMDTILRTSESIAGADSLCMDFEDIEQPVWMDVGGMAHMMGKVAFEIQGIKFEMWPNQSAGVLDHMLQTGVTNDVRHPGHTRGTMGRSQLIMPTDLWEAVLVALLDAQDSDAVGHSQLSLDEVFNGSDILMRRPKPEESLELPADQRKNEEEG